MSSRGEARAAGAGDRVPREVRDARGWIARLIPMAEVAPRPRAASGRPVLSRFACLRWRPGGLLIESPLSGARVELAARALPRLVAALEPNGKPATADPLVRLLDQAGMLTRLEATGRTTEERDPALQTWEFADLLFHARSRLGRHDNPAGALFPQRGRLRPLPAAKPRRGRGIALPRPDLVRLGREDRPFSAVLEARRSLRGPAARLRLPQLGEFLYRVARVRGRRAASTRLPYATTSRPYPSGGACYPLELYLAVRNCDGLLPGLYHYDPVGHRLEPLPGGAAEVGPLLRDTRQPLPRGAAPVLIVITARFGRVSWKYRSMAYSVVLKEVGVVMQTMYLVAAAMGLSPCAIGCGDAERSARALGTGFTTESSVGEFLLGGPALPERPRRAR